LTASIEVSLGIDFEKKLCYLLLRYAYITTTSSKLKMIKIYLKINM